MNLPPETFRAVEHKLYGFNRIIDYYCLLKTNYWENFESDLSALDKMELKDGMTAVCYHCDGLGPSPSSLTFYPAEHDVQQDIVDVNIRMSFDQYAAAAAGCREVIKQQIRTRQERKDAAVHLNHLYQNGGIKIENPNAYWPEFWEWMSGRGRKYFRNIDVFLQVILWRNKEGAILCPKKNNIGRYRLDIKHVDGNVQSKWDLKEMLN